MAKLQPLVRQLEHQPIVGRCLNCLLKKSTEQRLYLLLMTVTVGKRVQQVVLTLRLVPLELTRSHVEEVRWVRSSSISTQSTTLN